MNIYFKLPENTTPCVLTLGAFDGLHRGHKKILEKVKGLSQKHKLPSVAVTFHPHPRRVLQPDNAPGLLTVLSEKIDFLSTCGIDTLVVLPFTKSFSKTPAEVFLKDMLFRSFLPREIVIGYDFSFGKDREGSLNTIRKYAHSAGKEYNVHVMPPVKTGKEIISSTRIRRLMEHGKITDASRCLGHPYFLFGKVVEGEKRGKTLGFPTANLRFSDEKQLPSNGVYAVRAQLLTENLKLLKPVPARNFRFQHQHTGKIFAGVANLGIRPTFHHHTKTFEVHLLDMRKNLYGKMLRVEFIKFLREEKKFKSVDALITQIQKDIQKARKISSA